MTSDKAIPPDLRPQLEVARLDNLALMRALDRVFPGGPPIPPAILRRLYELEADCAEALSVLDRPPGRIDWRAMVHDTLASLGKLPDARERVRAAVSAMSREALVEAERAIRAALDASDAYSQIPGRDRGAPRPKAPPAKTAAPPVRSNDPCPCGSGKKYKRCCAKRAPAGAAEGKATFHFEPGSYGGRGAFCPSILCAKVTDTQRQTHFVLVNPEAAGESEEDAVEEAVRDLDAAFSGGGDPERVALHLRELGYMAIEDPRMAVD